MVNGVGDFVMMVSFRQAGVGVGATPASNMPIASAPTGGSGARRHVSEVSAKLEESPRYRFSHFPSEVLEQGARG